MDKQKFTWREMVQPPTSKLVDDAFTRVRIILMNGLESEMNRFSHACARMNRDLQEPLAQVRRVEQHQQTMVNWLLPGDMSPLETTIGFEQVAIEVTASVAMREPDEYMAQVYRFGLLEDFDHMYRFAALYDRTISQSLNALMTAELTDNAAWELLIDLAEECGHSDLADQFTEALNNEQKHLLNVQTWLSERIMAKV